MIELKRSNWNLPSDKRWELISDLTIYGAPLFVSAIMTLPIQETLKLWLCFPFTLIVAVAKIIAKFTKDIQN